jgi:hypothetical protein
MKARACAAPAVLAVLVLLLAQPTQGGAAEQATAPRTIDVPLFTISKSENRNQVQYVVRVDEHCAPLSDAPVWAYWKMIELGAARTAPLLGRELPAYGAKGQSIVERRPEGARIRLVLRAMPSRAIDVETGRSAAGTCAATCTMTIAGAPARLFDVYAKLKWPAGVDCLLIQGWSLDGTHVVTEQVKG